MTEKSLLEEEEDGRERERRVEAQHLADLEVKNERISLINKF